MEKVKVMVIGAGNMGKNHVRTYAGLPFVDLVAVVEPHVERGKEIAEIYNTRLYADYKEAIVKERPLLVSVCVPTIYHYKIAKDCLESGVHVLLEKPITNSVETARDLLNIAKASGRKLYVGHIERFNPVVQKAKDFLNQGELGDIIAISARRVGGLPPQIKDVDIAVDLAIHDIDIVNYILGETPKQVTVNKQSSLVKDRADSVEIFARYSSASAYIQANWITPVKIRKLSITGTKGYLELDYIKQQLEFYKTNFEVFEGVLDDFSSDFMHFSDPDKTVMLPSKKEPLKQEIIFFIDAILNDVDLDVNFAVDALEIALSKV